ncbi:MAG TPA: FtsK/SpoIIIE domain-containing protein [Mycobacteriales bacterium]|nr:FtsK/SpoIIIE domain-containing protein [Mycobacteriales bacterium]
MPIVLTPRPARIPVERPEAAVLRIPPPPSVPVAHEGIATALLAGAGSLGTLAVLGMGRRSSPLLLIALGLATLGASVGARVLVLRRSGRQLRRASARWTARVDSAVDHARAGAARQRSALRRAHPVGVGALRAVAGGGVGLWERRPADADAWSVAVGTGTVPASLRLDTDAADAAADVPAALEQIAQRAVADHAAVTGAPVAVDLGRGACAAVGARDVTRALARHVLLELCVARPPEELRVAVLTDDPTAWTWLAWLPHTDEVSRGVVTSAADLGRSLTGAADVLVVVDTHEVVPDALRARARWLWLADTEHDLPARVATTVVLDGEAGVVRDAVGVTQLGSAAVLDVVDADDVARRLAPRRLVQPTGRGDESVRLAELLDVDPLHLDAAAHWRRVRSPLAVPIGRDAAGAPVVLDLAEPALGGHGPHGLLIGATGSGKSELLRSLVTGLAVNAPPEDVALLLVDWKGGAAFDGLAQLPHVAGLVTNLAGDAALVDRVCASLRGELERRQVLLRHAKADSVRSLRDRGDAAPPALVVVIDEFGELLSAHPDALDVLLQVGRLGRSLAVHLVLASQRLDEGRLRGLEAHLRFRLCLRTFTAAESVAVLGGPEAASLPSRPGEGWLAVDGERTRLRAAHTTAPARPAAPGPPVRPLHPSTSDLWQPTGTEICHIPDVGGTSSRSTSDLWQPGGPEICHIPDVDGTSSRSTSDLWQPAGPEICHNADVDELGALVAAIGRAGATPAQPVWLPPLGANLTGIDAVAVVDEPAQQRQVPWSPSSHTAVVGAPGSGVSTALSAIVAERLRDPDVRIVALRFGGEGLVIDASRIVGEAGPRDDPAHVALLLDAAVLAARDEGPWAGRHLMLVVDGLARARDVVDDLDQRLARAAAGALLAVGGHRWTDVRGGLRDLTADRLELRLADPADSEHPRDRARQLMGGPPGRGLLADGRLVQVVRPQVGSASEEDTLKLRPLPVHVRAPLGSAALGVRIGDHREVQRPEGHLVVLGDRGSGRTGLLKRLAHLAAAAGEPAVIVDPRRRMTSIRGTVIVDANAIADHLSPFTSGLVLIDDADLVPAHRLAVLLDPVADGRCRIVLARPVTGAARAAYDPLMTALREALATTLVLPGDPGEGPLVAGVRAAPGPPGRAVLVEPGRPPMPLQLYAPDDGDGVVVPLRERGAA